MRPSSYPVPWLLGALLAATGASAEPLDLAACVRRALAGNPSVQDARDATTAAGLGRDLALSEYNLKLVPSVDGGISGANETDQRYQMLFRRKLLASGTELALTGGTNVYSSVPRVSIPYLTETRLSVLQPLFQGRSRLENREQIDDAERRMDASAHALRSAREDLALRVVRSYYDVVGAGELLTVAGQSLARVEELREVADVKLSLGTVSKMDVFRADLHAARIRNALVEQQARHDAGLDSLKTLLGIDPRVKLEIDPRIQGPSASDLVAQDLDETALERRVEMVEAKQQVADAERKLVLARQRLWPAVYLAGFYARQGLGDTFDDSLTLDREEWTVGLRSSVPLDRTPEQVAIAEAELALRGRERQYRVVRDEVLRQVRDARRQLERSRAERALAAEIATHADSQVELARFRYEKGVTDNFDLVQAEEQRTEARSTSVLAAIEEAVAAAVVRRATGTLEEAFVRGGEAPPTGSIDGAGTAGAWAPAPPWGEGWGEGEESRRCSKPPPHPAPSSGSGADLSPRGTVMFASSQIPARPEPVEGRGHRGHLSCFDELSTSGFAVYRQSRKGEVETEGGP